MRDTSSGFPSSKTSTYRVLDTSGKELKTYYKCIGFDNGYQFRCYDLNNCHITASRFAPSYKNPADIDTWLANGYGFDSSDYNSDGTPKIPNRVLINVFAYDTNWKVEVLEDGKCRIWHSVHSAECICLC